MKIKKTKTIKFPINSKKSTKADSTIIYVFNYTDNNNNPAGFSIISGDNRVPGVLCFSEQGNLYDTITNPVITLFLSALPGYMNKRIEYENRKNDSILRITLSKINNQLPDSIKINTKYNKNISPDYVETNPPVTSYGNWSITNEILTPIRVKWGQADPFNRLLNPITCENKNQLPNAGCVIVAVGHILAYHKQPQKINEYIFDWDDITSKPLPINETMAYSIAKLFKEMGKGMNTDYRCEGAFTFITDAVNWLKAVGYTTGEIQNYNIETIQNSLNTNSPVLISGKAITDIKETGWWIFKEKTPIYVGHSWVIDGYIKRTRPVYVTTFLETNGEINMETEFVYMETEEYFRYGIGWGGQYDGYFLSGVFDMNNKTVLLKTIDPDDFKYYVQIIPFIKPL